MNTKSTISQREAYRIMLKEYPDVMGIEQMCEILGISTKTGYRLLHEGKICCIKVGRAYRIPKAHLFTYLCIGCPGTTKNELSRLKKPLQAAPDSVPSAQKPDTIEIRQ